MTNQELIERAMILIGALDSGGTPTSAELSDMLSALNQMMAMWAENDMNLQFPPQDTLGDTYPLQLWTEEPVAYNLAVRAATLFDLPVPPDVAFMANEGASFIAKKLINDALEPADLSHMPAGGGRWNIITDSIL